MVATTATTFVGRKRSTSAAAFFFIAVVAGSLCARFASSHLSDFFPTGENNERTLQLRRDNKETQKEADLFSWIDQITNLMTSETTSGDNEQPQDSSSKSYSYPAAKRENKTLKCSTESRGGNEQLHNQEGLPLMHSKESLRALFTTFIEREVHFNNPDLGCNDLQFLAPYIKAIMDRFSWNGQRKRQMIFDVGANNGDDAVSILGSFQPVRGMCWILGTPILLFSIEPSPKVFCEMTELMENKAIADDKGLQQIHLLNVALSDRTGNLIFQDPGNEGGRLIGSNYSSLEPMTPDEWSSRSQCHLSADYKNQSVDYKRQTQVPTYTLDLLLDSLDGLGKVDLTHDRIFVLKVDTEGHDYKVLLGAKQLLLQKQIEFIIFETSQNHLLKSTVEFMDSTGYECYLVSPRMLVPVHAQDWWYQHLDNFTDSWWGNCICGSRGSKSLAMLWSMYHSDDMRLANSYTLMHEK